MVYGKVLISVLLVSAIIYFQTDTSALFHSALKGLFGLGVVSLVIQCVDWSCLSIIKRWKNLKNKEELNYDAIKSQQDQARERTQIEHLEKASSYKERILKPREDAKKKQKEEEYYKFMGPAWKGQGHALGLPSGQQKCMVTIKTVPFDYVLVLLCLHHMNLLKPEVKSGASEGDRGNIHQNDDTVQDAAQHRVLPENINETVLQAAREEMARQRTVKKKIELPDEPPDGADSSILVVLRTPLGQIQQRRFLDTETIQTILDYMTTLGFHQRNYTVCTSYPRECLTEQRERTLTEMGFRRKITLNIEELE